MEEELCEKLTQCHIDDIDKNEVIITIQKMFRRYYFRKNLRKVRDSMTFALLNRCINNYNATINFEDQINQKLKKKKIRKTNFPSHISENIAKFGFCKKYGVMPTWDTDKGDIVLDNRMTKFLRIEVKGSIDLSNGPPTFGPTESWDLIYFVDGVKTHLKKYKIYEIKLSNQDEKWQNLKVNKTETYQNQCNQKRRPRLTFNEIYKQLGNDCRLIFDGHISELNQSNQFIYN